MADFGGLTVEAFRKDGDISFVDSDGTVSEALDVIFSRDVYSVPVYDVSKSKYVGLVDLVDLVAYLVSLFKAQAGVSTAAELADVVSSQFKRDLQAISDKFFNEKISNIMVTTNQSDQTFRALPHDTPIADAIKYLTADTRRLPIENQGKVIQMVSQADIVRYIHSAHMRTLESKLKRPVGDYMRKAIDILPTTRTLDAFATMHEAQISALPIVDRAQEMQLVGVVTLKDIKTALEDFKQLFVPIEDYVAQIRQKNVGTLREYPFISMQETDTLEKAINKMMAAKIHRVFIKKQDQQALYVLSLKDILQSLLS